MIYYALGYWVAGLLPLFAESVFKRYFVGDVYWDIVFPTDCGLGERTIFDS